VTGGSVKIPYSSGSVILSSHLIDLLTAEVVKVGLYATAAGVNKCTGYELCISFETFRISGKLPAFFQELGQYIWT